MSELREITQEQLKDILKKHLAWLNNDIGGERANLSFANLRSADLRSANLRSANLRSADLRFANLSSANLRFADLSSANLRSADLRFADLRSANLRFADLRSANLSSANLSSANLSSADLRSANLRSADLRSANLDFSVFPLWCGSLDIKVDLRLSAQLAYHFCRLDTDDKDVKKAQKALKLLANKFHRAKECGEIK